MPYKSRKSGAKVSNGRTAQAAALRRTTRQGKKPSQVQYESSSELESSDAGEDGESATDGDAEDEEEEEPEDEPKGLAPSRSTKRRGRQTGLSKTLSKADIASANGRKRAYSSSSEDTVTARPTKQYKVDLTPSTSDDMSSGDEAYNGVNDISESEDEIGTMRRERQAIQEEIEGGGDAFLFNEDLDTAFAEQFASTDIPALSDFYSSEAPFEGLASTVATGETTTRRVRFAGIDSSSSSSSSNGSDFGSSFPDLMAHELDYSSQHPFEVPDEDEDGSSESYWELDNQPSSDHHAEAEIRSQQHGFVDEVDASSGYETGSSDDGTTTEEEYDTLHAINTPKKMLELRSTSPQPEGSKPKRLSMPRNRPMNPKNRKGPVMGTWIADPSKPIAVVDKHGGLKYYHVPSKTYGTMSDNVSSVDSSPQRSFVPLARPVSASGASQAEEPSSQLTSPGATADMFSPFLPMEFADTAALFDDEESEDDIELNINDFIDMGDDTSEDEEASDANPPETPAKSFSMSKLPKITPKQSADRPSSHNLLEHLDRGVVSAFRRNQTRAQSITSRLPIASPLTSIKGGRHNSANNPISPLRRRKPSSSMSNVGPSNGVNSKMRYATAPTTRGRQNTL